MSSVTPQAVPHPLVVRTVAVDDPGDLIGLLPRDDSLAWVRRGDGIVGWGEALRIEVRGAGRFELAQERWREALASVVVRDEVNLPGTGPVAFGSFAFDDDGDGVLIVPRVVVGRRAGVAWLTTIDTAATLGPAPTLAGHLPEPEPVTPPGPVTFSDGRVPTRQWPAVVQRAVAAVREGRVEKVVMARDVVAQAEGPVDVRWLLGRLEREYSACWTFRVGPMLGATPELLVRAEKGLVTSRVLAGTIRRTGDDEADLARAAILAHSSKDLEEHEYAV
ncbi:MAG: isochorismate synthase, partial [Actinomycetales bacterium]|nr:isochorismate synthase [Actinomycetales bacterium]